MRYLSALFGPLVVIAVGAALAYRFLYFSPAEAAYFAATTLATIGYGDLTPTDLPRMLATGFYGVVAAGLGGWFVWHSVRVLRERTDQAARRMFLVSLVYLFALFLAMLVDFGL